jgi:NAD(P)H dehydrogenase (quinone)
MTLNGRKVLIVLAHPEPKSFTASWARASAEAAKPAGAEVTWSDLLAMGFDPVEDPRHYPVSPTPFDPLKAHEAAVSTKTLPPDAGAEAEKILAADAIIFHFPLWWFGPPAILKGWLDRCLIHGALHDIEHRFDAGRLRGKRALFCVSTGASAEECGPGGKEGDVRLLLWPLAYTLRYCGMDVCEPALIHGVHGYYDGAEKPRWRRACPLRSPIIPRRSATSSSAPRCRSMRTPTLTRPVGCAPAHPATARSFDCRIKAPSSRPSPT